MSTKAMTADVSTILECSATKAWDEVQKSSLHRHVTWPLTRIVSTGTPFPERWIEGATIRCRLFISGIIPMGVHTLFFEKIDQRNYEIQSREHDALVARWDHLVSIQPLDGSRSIYRDTIEINAGIFTFVVWAWANWFYRHRQRRWRALAKTL